MTKPLGLFLFMILLLSGCDEPSFVVEGTVSDVYIGTLTPAVSGGPYTFLRFVDGRISVLHGSSPQPIEKDRYQKITFNRYNVIMRVEMASPQRPQTPSELR
jgi:hypothetical protein